MKINPNFIKIMEKHYGQIIEYVIRKKGFNISDLARSLNINRRSLYNWFNQKNLAVCHITKIGNIIRHDFSAEFPELLTKDDFKVPHSYYFSENTPSVNQILYTDWKEKYIKLLEDYNNALLSKEQQFEFVKDR